MAPLSEERLAEIRGSVSAAPHPAPGTWAAGLRDLLAEVDRLQSWGEAQEKRVEDVFGVLGQVEIADSESAWELGMSVLALLDGPPVRSTSAERADGLRVLVRRLRARLVAAAPERDRLLAERATTNAVLHDVQVEREGLLKRITELEADSARLNALDAAGVDNWEGYDDAVAGDRS